MQGKYIQLIDLGLQQVKMKFDVGAAVGNILTFLSNYSRAGVTGGSMVTPILISPTAAQVTSDCGRRMLGYYYDGDGVARSGCVLAPNPSSLPSMMTDKGERLTVIAGETWATDHATINGFSTTTITFSVGIFIDPRE